MATESRKFIPHPTFALGKSKYNPDIHEGYYLYDYIEVERKIESGEWDRLQAYRALILKDLWFLLYFIIGTPDTVGGNHPFIVMRCNEIQEGPESHTLDVWARGHLKSSIITIAETIQYQMGHPEHCSCILSYKASVAKDKFLGSIKTILETSEYLKKCFPDVLWDDPKKEAPRWSLDGGLYLKRNTKRGEASIYAGGLIEGMPTGLHFERRVYDDVVTEDIGSSIGMMEDVKKKFDSSQNLKMMVGESYHRVVGTFYHHKDPLVYVREKLNAGTDKKKYHLRIYPATDDGSHSGKPVFVSQETLDDMKSDKTFACQQLCDPSPVDIAKLEVDHIEYIAPSDIPLGCFLFIIVDQAGDDEFNVTEGDPWCILTFDVKPHLTDVGASDIYIKDIISETFSSSAGINAIVEAYVDAGVVRQLGIEKVGMSVTHTQVREALRSRGRRLEIITDPKKRKSNAIVLLKPSGRNKEKFIESAISWPLDNGKIHISTEVQNKYIEKLALEMMQFPYGVTDDILNCLAYAYDIVLNYEFPTIKKEERINRAMNRPSPMGWAT